MDKKKQLAEALRQYEDGAILYAEFVFRVVEAIEPADLTTYQEMTGRSVDQALGTECPLCGCELPN